MHPAYSIQVEHFTKRYGDFTAVDDVSFAVEEGSIFAFLGPNGAGKSTTINTLCTIQEKTAGTLIINGHDVSRRKDRVRNDIGIVFQESTLDGKLTIRENLKLHCDFYGVPSAEVDDRIGFVLDLVDIADWAGTPVDGLSGGMKRRVEIARGLVHFPRVLFLDEPTTGLDPQTRANVWEYIRAVQKEKGITIFLTTHYMDEAEICNRVAVIDHGRIVAHDTPANLKKEYAATTVKMRHRDPRGLVRHLEERGIQYLCSDGYYRITTPGTGAALELACAVRDGIEDIEISAGSLNDVFITITGREIRE